MDHLAAFLLHVVAQVVEAQFIVGRIGDVAVVGLSTLELRQVGDNRADGQAKEAVDLPHPFRVAPGKVVVHRDDMDALALQRVEIDRQRRHQRRALAGAHFRDLAAVEHDAADHLHVEVAHPHAPPARLAHRGEGFGQQVVERCASRQPLPELHRLGGKLVVGHGLHRRLEAVDLAHDLVE